MFYVCLPQFSRTSVGYSRQDNEGILCLTSLTAKDTTASSHSATEKCAVDLSELLYFVVEHIVRLVACPLFLVQFFGACRVYLWWVVWL